jgi:cbb3-type cytochrome oxidase maturation protein
MSALILLICASLVMAVLFLCAFVWAVRAGQYDDTCTPSMRVLLDDHSNEPGTSVPRMSRNANEHER